MITLRIQHAVPNFEAWKKVFDRDPIDRKGSGVRRYSVYRLVADSNLVTIDLEFDHLGDAESVLAKLRELWKGPGGAVMRNPEASILEKMETVNL